LFHPYATHTHTLDEDQETKMVSSNSASLSTGFDITIDEDGIDMNETFSISLPSGHSTDMKRRVHTTYSDYMGSNSDHLVEEVLRTRCQEPFIDILRVISYAALLWDDQNAQPKVD
jgi:hypothetical protein